RIHAMGDFLREEIAAGREYLPAGGSVFRAFSEPLARVKVLIVGQDPYPTAGHPIGLSFAVDPEVRPLPRSLGNIYKELEADLGIAPAAHGDLRAWSRQGVMLLNRVLTVAPGQPASHRGKGWEEITERAITALIERDQPLVAILWGRDARSLAPLLRSGVAEVAIIESPHPSPLSASRGFFGSRPFSRTNDLLAQKGIAAIDWVRPAPARLRPRGGRPAPAAGVRDLRPARRPSGPGGAPPRAPSGGSLPRAPTGDSRPRRPSGDSRPRRPSGDSRPRR